MQSMLTNMSDQEIESRPNKISQSLAQFSISRYFWNPKEVDDCVCTVERGIGKHFEDYWNWVWVDIGNQGPEESLYVPC